MNERCTVCSNEFDTSLPTPNCPKTDFFDRCRVEYVPGAKTHCSFCANKLDEKGACPHCTFTLTDRELSDQIKLIRGGVRLAHELWCRLSNEVSISDRLLEDVEHEAQSSFGDLLEALRKLDDYAEGKCLLPDEGT